MTVQWQETVRAAERARFEASPVGRLLAAIGISGRWVERMQRARKVLLWLAWAFATRKLKVMVGGVAAAALIVVRRGRRRAGRRGCAAGVARATPMRTYVREARGVDPPRRPRRVLRGGRATGRPSAARPPRDRGRRRRARRELRGEGARRRDSDGPAAGSPAVSGCDRRSSANVGVLGGEQGGLPGVRRHDPGRGRAVDRRGLPRRSRARAALGHAHRDRRAVAARRPRARRPADHGRHREDEVPREGGERSRQAGRFARGAAGRRARLPASAARRTALGRGTRDRKAAPRRRDHDGRAGRAASRGDARLAARPSLGTTPPRACPQP